MGLLLNAVDADGPWRWRWLLSDEDTGNPVADHSVSLDPASVDVTRFTDLHEYADLYAAPDRRARDEARFVVAAGQWAGRELLGQAIGDAIVAWSPVTVRVRVPAALDAVLLWPLELAHADGLPLAARGDVTLVYDIAPDAPAPRKAAAGTALRVLAVFSQPTKTDLLALRRERYALSRLIRQIAARERAAVELRVVHYGVTRELLGWIADAGDGWDVLHLSGHGAGGVFALERADGSPDLVPTADLVRLLRPMRRRVRLAVVSACESAADATAETYRLLGLIEQAEALEAESATQADAEAAAAVPGLARALVRELGCAVVGMRYPVIDEFAIAFDGILYERLLSRRQPVDVAVARALAEAARPGTALPTVSLATPGVFGTTAIGLRLTVPRGQPRIDPASQRMAYFPDEPTRFVGRAEAMARASAALAPRSGKTGVLLHGMAGAGKTACALELAYRHQDAFAALAFWQAPTRAEEWASALPDLARQLDIQLADYGFTMTSHIGTVASLEAFLPRLRAAMADAGMLLVLDNLETLLTPGGGWHDPRWEKLITALVSHDGESRVILTSRVAPAGLGAFEVVTLPVHALSLAESVVLARELPNLRALLRVDSADADAGPVRAGGTDPEAAVRAEAAVEADRGRVRRVLRVVQGHPKLMELARALLGVDPGAAERLLHAALAAADTAGDHRTASRAAGDLVNLLQDAGRLAEGLAAAGQKAEYTRRAGLGPWTQLGDQAQRLQVLGMMGEHAQVLAEMADLRAVMAGLPDRSGPGETVVPWNIRELILDTVHTSAVAMGDWQQCLDLNAEIAASLRRHGAGKHEVASTRLNDATPLIKLGRMAEAGRLLAECQRVFEDHADTASLATVLGARASLEAALGHRQAAADLARAALRLRYVRPEPRSISISHHNLANYLGELGGERAGQRAHRLAAALIRRLSGDDHYLANAVGALAAVLRRILDGERGEPLLDGLDPVDTAIAREVLTRLA